MNYQKILDQFAENRARIVRMHKSGISQSDIARKLGISRQRVSQVVLGAKKSAD